MDYAVNGLPAVQLALMYRCCAQGPGGLQTGTLMNDELAAEMDWGEVDAEPTAEEAEA